MAASTQINRESAAPSYPSPATIRRLRRAAGYNNLEQIARRVGVCPRSMQHYEDGTRRMSNVLVCVRFAEAVRVELSTLLGTRDAAAPSVQFLEPRDSGGNGAAA